MLERNLLERWVENLRSGRYKQGTRRLWKDVNGERHYCCLGVLCDTAGVKMFQAIYDPHLSQDTIGSAPEELGLTRAEVEHLWMMNDGEDNDGNDKPYKTFAQIADWIEKNINHA
jgi:hypothetical protein